MAQVGRRAYRQAQEAPWAAWDATDGAAGGGLGAALRLGEVPRAALVAIAVLAVTSVALGAVLFDRLSDGSFTVAVSDAQEEVREDGEADAAAQGSPEVDGAAPQAEGDVDTGGPALRVHVAGAVAAPGVYGLDEGARVLDAVEAAGGFADDADPSALNLAEPLTDGCKVTVPAVGQQVAGVSEASAVEPASSGSAAADATVNINTAGVEELQELPGVGEATAEAIVRDREQNGPFSSPEDIMRVSGIGEKKFERMRDMVSV